MIAIAIRTQNKVVFFQGRPPIGAFPPKFVTPALGIRINFIATGPDAGMLFGCVISKGWNPNNFIKRSKGYVPVFLLGDVFVHDFVFRLGIFHGKCAGGTVVVIVVVGGGTVGLECAASTVAILIVDVIIVIFFIDILGTMTIERRKLKLLPNRFTGVVATRLFVRGDNGEQWAIVQADDTGRCSEANERIQKELIQGYNTVTIVRT